MRKLALSKPSHSDRIVGFTIPKARTFFVCDHDEVWRAAIEPDPLMQVTDHAPYKFIEDRTDFLGLVFEGLPQNRPLLRARQSEIFYEFNPKQEFVTVDYVVAGRAGKIEFPTFSGDWFAASLSDDGRHLVLAEPYDLAVYAVV